ncbi:MAG: hypothetical protein EZS28_022725 [Streblomastix strix]|uniref:Uncharacterized protein n=1 Tax=Streblomastix strix TaxID=222440 RepID=A0A5J4VGM2_9EUKA|nr:MAG: hypothetical protein EZS28_022725 [Streblomastix strix]
MSKRETQKGKQSETVGLSSANPKRPKGLQKNKPTANNVNEYMQLKKPFTHLGQTVNPLNIAKVTQILQNLGKYQQAQGRMKQSDYQTLLRWIHQVDNSVSAYEADAGIQGLKGTIRKQRIYGSFDPTGLVADTTQTQQLMQQILAPQQLKSQQQANFNHNLNINDRLDQPSQRGPSKIEPSAPDHSIGDSDDERMELFGGYNRYQVKPNQELNLYSQNTDQQTDFAQQVDAIQEDIEEEKEEEQEEQELEEDNAETNRELQYIGRLNQGQETVNPHYDKRSFAQINDFGYRIIDQGLSVYAKKKPMSEEEQLNQPKKQKKYFSNKELKSTLKAQSKLKKQTSRQSRKKPQDKKSK